MVEPLVSPVVENLIEAFPVAGIFKTFLCDIRKVELMLFCFLLCESRNWLSVN